MIEVRSTSVRFRCPADTGEAERGGRRRISPLSGGGCLGRGRTFRGLSLRWRAVIAAKLVFLLLILYDMLLLYQDTEKGHHNGVLFGKLWTSDLFTAISCSSTFTCCILTAFGFGSTSCRTASFSFATSFTSCHISTSYFKDELHNGFVF